MEAEGAAVAVAAARAQAEAERGAIRGNHLSKTTCLTHVFLNKCEYCSELN